MMDMGGKTNEKDDKNNMCYYVIIGMWVFTKF